MKFEGKFTDINGVKISLVGYTVDNGEAWWKLHSDVTQYIKGHRLQILSQGETAILRYGQTLEYAGYPYDLGMQEIRLDPKVNRDFLKALSETQAGCFPKL